VLACLPNVRTIDAVDADDIFEDRGTLVWRLPVQRHPVGLDSSERDEGSDGDFEAEDLHELLNGLREDLVCAEGDPERMCEHVQEFGLRGDVPEEGQHNAGRAHPARGRVQHRLHVVATDIGRPVER
jgi:hypothetical protein